jgi:hypothetical protein
MSSDHKDPPVSPKDEACAVFARAALFPVSVDWDGTHHNIHPALEVLDKIRSDVIERKGTSFSSLFPRRVMLVPSAQGGMKWSGQPDINESSVEVIPQVLQVTCMECLGPQKAFLRKKELSYQASSTDIEKTICHEIVLCTNRLLQSDVSKASSLIDGRKDLPASSLKPVEEALAHQLVKVRSILEDASSVGTCEKYAALEVMATQAAECLYQRSGSEIRRGGSLRPPGFSLLPGFLQQNLQSCCIRAVATKETSYKFGDAEAKRCVQSAMGTTK